MKKWSRCEIAIETLEPLDRRLLLAARIGLDPTWGNSTTDVGMTTIPGVEYSYATLVQAQPDGKILIAGLAGDPQGSDRSFNFAITRLNADGTIDTSYGTGGSVKETVGITQAFSATTEPDGKMLFAGSNPEATNMSVLRLNADGTVDTSFGTNGVVSFFQQSSIDDGIVEQSWTMATQPDGKILVAGDMTDVLHGSAGSNDTRHAEVARLTADGRLDTTFNGDGTFTLDSLWSELRGVIVLGDGKILALGNGPGETDGLLLRFNTNGSLDTTFDGDGMLLIPGTRTLGQPAQSPNGQWVIGGIGLVRLNADGTPDTTWGTNGVVQAPPIQTGAIEFDTPVVDSAGRIVATWGVLGGGAGGLTRYLPDGTPDDTFADRGFLKQDFIAGPVVFQGDDDHLIVRGSGVFDLQRFAPVQPVLLTSDGILFVNATPQADDVLVEPTASNDRLLVNGTETLFAKNAVKGVNIYLDAGDDAARVLIDVPATVTAGSGDDLVETGGGDDSIDGGGGDDTIRSGDGADTIDAGDGNNHIFSGNNTNGAFSKISAGNGNDVISAGDGNRWVTAGDGDNQITLGHLGGYCDLESGDGNDAWTISSVRDGQMSLTAGGGDDTITSGGGSDTIFTGEDDQGNPTSTVRADTIFGGAGNDIIHGGLGRQIIYGDDGNDSLYGEAGSDYLIGGRGNDLLSGGGSRDYLVGGDGADRLYGGNGNDRLQGDANADRLFGGAGDDEVFGGGGNDHINGGDGDDELHGGAGADTFITADNAIDHLFGDAGHDTAVVDVIDILTSVEVST